jgi:hypothetical protein
VLRLQHALAQPGSGYPIRFRGLAIARQVDEYGVVSWIEFEDRSKAEDGKSWTIRRRIADAEGNFSPDTSTQGLERAGATIRAQDGNAVYLELKSLAGDVHVERLPALFAGALPHSLLATPQLEAFRKLYGAAEGSPCLVVGDDRGTTRWFSPKFGLVREKILGGWTRDLVYWRGAP